MTIRRMLAVTFVACTATLAAQTYPPALMEVVIACDGSDDGTAALAAGTAAIELYHELEQDGSYLRLNGLSERFAAGLRAVFAARSVPFHANQLGPMLQLFLSDATPSFESFAGLPPGPIQLFYLALINEGVLLSLPTSNHVYLSFAHTDADISTVLEKVAVVLDRYDFREIVRAAIPAS